MLSVGQLAEAAGVSVRTLHHYDDIGLLRPGARSQSGYRLYGEADLERLQQILFYRELGFSLQEIRSILREPGTNPIAHLRRQHRLLVERIKRLQAMVTAVEHTMEVQRLGISLTPEERFEVFGEWSPEDHAEEVEERWGASQQFQQSQQRVAGYSKQDWLRIKAEAADIEERLAKACRSGVPPDSAEAMELAEGHRQHISRYFYDCSYEMHRGLGEMFVADPRFRERYEGIAPGLAAFVSEAVRANADRAQGER